MVLKAKQNFNLTAELLSPKRFSSLKSVPDTMTSERQN
jgi:hypothetical protein